MNKKIEDYIKNKEIKEFTPGFSDSKTYCIDDKIFLKIDKKGELYNEYVSLKLFYNNGLSPKPLKYLSLDKDYLFIEKVYEDIAFDKLTGDSLISFIGKSLRDFHEKNFCFESLTKDEKKIFFEKTKYILNYITQNYYNHSYNKKIFECFKESDINDVFKYIVYNKGDLKDDVIIHGDFNARNIFVSPNNFYKVIDTGESGLTDRHIDIAFALFALKLQTNELNIENKFLDAYGNDKINEKRLNLCKKISILYYF